MSCRQLVFHFFKKETKRKRGWRGGESGPKICIRRRGRRGWDGGEVKMAAGAAGCCSSFRCWLLFFLSTEKSTCICRRPSRAIHQQLECATKRRERHKTGRRSQKRKKRGRFFLPQSLSLSLALCCSVSEVLPPTGAAGHLGRLGTWKWQLVEMDSPAPVAGHGCRLVGRERRSDETSTALNAGETINVESRVGVDGSSFVIGRLAVAKRKSLKLCVSPAGPRDGHWPRGADGGSSFKTRALVTSQWQPVSHWSEPPS